MWKNKTELGFRTRFHSIVKTKLSKKISHFVYKVFKIFNADKKKKMFKY